MEDIRLAIGLIGFLSAGAFALTFRLLRRRSEHFLDAMAVIVVGLIGVYVYTVWGQLWIVNWIPLPSVIVLSNWFPILLSTLGAIVWLRMQSFSVGRRFPIMVIMLVAAVYSIVHFIPAAPPECRNEWERPVLPMIYPVCKQTTPYTCSAAAAATILNTIGLETTEQEMAELCLTRSGTTWLGLYHGLATKLLGTKYQVEFFHGSIADIERSAQSAPILLCCELDADVAEMVPSYVNDGGWIPETAHSVVYFGSVRGLHIIGDPSRGYEAWKSQDLAALWTGDGLRIRHVNDPPWGQ